MTTEELMLKIRQARDVAGLTIKPNNPLGSQTNESPDMPGRFTELAAGHTEGGHDAGEQAHDEHANHDKMFFRAWQRTADGNIVELRPDQIQRDTSTFEDGHDPGIGADPQTPSVEHDHEHGDPH